MNYKEKIIYNLLGIFHTLLFIFPYLIFFMPKKLTYNSNIVKFIILIIFLTPLHWTLFGDLCVLNVIKSNIDIDNRDKWLLTNTDNTFMIYLNFHFFISYLLLWYYIFFKNNVC
jgi:hypothetical protein